MDDRIVIECNLCKAKFSVQDLIRNPELQPIGMIYDDTRLTAYYYYQHDTPDCGTSFIVDTALFKKYLEKPPLTPKQINNNACPRRCIMLKDLTACDKECYYAPFRRFLLYMVDQKRKAQTHMPASSRIK